MANVPEISLIQQSWLLGTFDDVLANSQNFNWNIISTNNRQTFMDGSFVLAALLLSGNGIKAFDIVNKYNLSRFSQTVLYALTLNIINHDFADPLNLLKGKNIVLREPTNFYTLQSKQDENQLYPEIKEAKRYLADLFNRFDKKTAVDFLFNETYLKNNFQAASALAELMFGSNILNEAFIAYSKCISFNPNSAFYWGETGRVLNNINYPVLALYFFTQAIKLDRYNAHWYFSKASAYARVLALYKKAWEIQADYKVLYGRIIWDEYSKNLNLAQNYVTNETPIELKNSINILINTMGEIRKNFGLNS